LGKRKKNVFGEKEKIPEDCTVGITDVKHGQKYYKNCGD